MSAVQSESAPSSQPWWKPLFFGDLEPTFANHCLVVACRFMVFYPALIVLSFPGCRIWAILMILFWLFSGHWKERLDLFRSNTFLALTIAYLAFAFLGIFYSSASWSDTLREWHGRQTLLVVPVIATLLYHCPERRAQMFGVYNLAFVAALISQFALFTVGSIPWNISLIQHPFYLFKNTIGTGMSLVLWAGLWIFRPFSSREIPWVRRLLSSTVIEALSAASRLHPWIVYTEVVARRLPWQAMVFALIRWGIILGIVAYLFCLNPSRTAQLAMLVSTALLFCLWSPRKGFVYVLVFSMLVLPLALFASPTFLDKIENGAKDVRIFISYLRRGKGDELINDPNYKAVADGRLLLYRGLTEKIMERPLFGFGMGSMETVCLSVPHNIIRNPHNEYLCVGVQSGLIGLSLFLLWLGWCFLGSFWKNTPWKQLGIFVSTALIVDCSFNCALSYSSASRFFGILLAVVFVADWKRKSQPPRLVEQHPGTATPSFAAVVQTPDSLIRKLEFLREVDKLKQVLRRNYVLGGVRRENDAEHSWHVALMSVLFADDAADANRIDKLRVLKMLLVHDLVEIDAGDTYAFDTKGNADKLERERVAADRIFKMLPEKDGVELRQLWEEFDAGETPDGKFALALDRLQPMLQNYLFEGAVWKQNGISPEQVADRLGPLRSAIPELGHVADAIIADAVHRGYFEEIKTFAVIIVAAGKSSRFGKTTLKKPFISLAGRPVWLHSAERFAARPDVRQLIVVVSADDEQWFREQYADEIRRFSIDVVCGGAERFQSVQNALETVQDNIGFVAVHDAARPCVSTEEIDAVFRAARESGAAMLAAPIVGTVKRIDSTRIVETVPREKLWEAQTPQVFERKLLLDAYAERFGQPTDDAQLVERLGKTVFVVPGDRRNLKITTRDDLEYLEQILSGE